MKKLIAVVALAVLCVTGVKATRTPIYRAAFRCGTAQYWAGGVCYPNGLLGGWSVINTNTTCYMYAGLSNGYMICDVGPDGCNGNAVIGSTHAEISWDSGATWWTLSDTTHDVYMAGREAEFDINNTGSLDGGHVRVACGGW